MVVSIHAPTRGATQRVRQIATRHVVSIHAPTRGATCRRAISLYMCRVSIHAPTRGATWSIRRPTETEYCFNPRPYKRGDYRLFARLSDELRFQSTPLQEGRRLPSLSFTPEENVSIHAPTRGATPHSRVDGGCREVSIHAPTRGATVKIYIVYARY